MNRCFGRLAELPVSRRVTRQWDMWQGGVAAVQARTRRNTVDAADTMMTTFVNPMDHRGVSETGDKTWSRKTGVVEMVKVDVGAQSRKAKRRSYERRQKALKRLNRNRGKAETLGENPLFDQRPQPLPLHSDDVSEGVPQTGVAICDYDANELDEISLREGDFVEQIVDVGEGWGQGTNARTGKTGTFPLSFVE